MIYLRPQQYDDNVKSTIKAQRMNEPNEQNKEKRNDAWSEALARIAERQCEASFSELFSHFAPLLKGFYMGSTPRLNADQAEELVQEVMCKVWLKASSFDSTKSAANTWVYTIARNSRIDFYRKNAKIDASTQPLVADDIWDEANDNQPYVFLSKSRSSHELDNLLKNLPVEQKQCLVKMYIEGKSHQIIADELDLPLGTVKSRIRLGLKRLQSRIKQSER